MAEYCRACQIKTEKGSPKIFIFNTVKLPDIFKETTSLDIHENDGLPKVLCCSCYDRLLEAYNFRKMCSATALHFQKILSMDVPEEKYIPPEDLTNSHLTNTSKKITNAHPDELNAPNQNILSIDIPEEKYIPPEDLNYAVVVSESHLHHIYSGKFNSPSERILEILVKDPALPEKTTMSKKLKRVNLECTICNLTFFRKEGLEKHMIIEHQELNGSFESLQEPLMVHSPLEKKYSPPNRKDSSLESPNILPIDQNPLASHDEDDSDDASLIARKTKNRQKSSGTQKKKRAQKMKHWRGQPLFECCLCNSTFRQKIRVEVHMRKVHLGLTPCVCKICGLGLTRLEGLKHHMKIHEDGKRYSCRKPGCNANFDTSTDLKSHMQTSHNETIWSCIFCSFNTLKLASMKRHVKIVHEKIKDFHCPYCQRAFGLEFSLKKHMMIHTGEKPFECSECGRKFSQSNKLKEHRIKWHQKFKSKDFSLLL